jgi:hypothetical protein
MGAGADAMSDLSRTELLPPPAEESGYDASGKSPDEIERDIAETRADLGDILDALERKLAPRQLLERGIDMVKDTMSGEGNGISELLRNNPVPLALIGLGVGWMLMGSSARARIGEYGGTLKERVSGAVESAGEKAGELAGQLRQKVSGSAADAGAETTPYSTEAAGYAYARQKSNAATERARQAASAAAGRLQETLGKAQQAGRSALDQARGYAGDAGQRLSQAGDRFSDMMEQHPLALGALALLAGAVVAMLLPASEIEERLVGPAADELRNQAADLGRSAVERAQNVAERSVDAAVEAAKDAVKEAGDALKSKAEQAASDTSVGQGQPGQV